MFWSPLEGFGFQGSYSDTKSAITPTAPAPPDPLPGLSGYVSNAPVLRTLGLLGPRQPPRALDLRRREFEGFGGDLERHALAGEKVVDAQVGYRLPDGR